MKYALLALLVLSSAASATAYKCTETYVNYGSHYSDRVPTDPITFVVDKNKSEMYTANDQVDMTYVVEEGEIAITNAQKSVYFIPMDLPGKGIEVSMYKPGSNIYRFYANCKVVTK